MRGGEPRYSRRGLLRAATMLGAGALVADPLARLVLAADTKTPAGADVVPTRAFGKGGTVVSAIALGTMFDTGSNHLLLRRAIQLGVTYWDTAAVYEGGDSEKGIGKYLAKFPEDRAKLFLVTKGKDRDVEGLQKTFDESLASLKTDYVDLFYFHAVSLFSEIKPEMLRWAEKMKAAGKIRRVGFSTHFNMANLLAEAAKAGWVEGILTSYNLGLRKNPQMQDAVQACHEAGIGLTAMKILRGSGIDMDDAEDVRLAGRYVKQGFSEDQAKLRVVLDDPRIASGCLTMKNMTLLTSFAAAAMGRAKL